MIATAIYCYRRAYEPPNEAIRVGHTRRLSYTYNTSTLHTYIE